MEYYKIAFLLTKNVIFFCSPLTGGAGGGRHFDITPSTRCSVSFDPNESLPWTLLKMDFAYWMYQLNRFLSSNHNHGN